MDGKPIDFVKKRKENIEKKRRAFERILFKDILGVYTVIDTNDGIFSIEMIDISKEGCLFQTPWIPGRDKKFKEESEIPLRMYFTKESFIPVNVIIKRASEHEQGGRAYMRYGCSFDKSVTSFSALNSFIDFLYKFAEHSAIDRGDPKVFFL